MCSNFLSISGRRARKLALLGVQKRVILTWGVEYRAPLMKTRGVECAATERTRERAPALS